MKLKTDAEGHAVLDNGKPVYIADDGRETAYDPPAMHATIGRLNKEAQGHREAKEAAEAAIKGFEGIDPAAARKALDVVKNLDEAKLLDAGKVEEIRLAAIKSVEDKYKPVTERNESLERELYAERIGGSFARSKVVAEKLTIPADIVQATFGKHFELKDGKILAKDASGNTIYSDENGGPAGFDEALEKLISAYPHRDKILKGSGHSGSGSNGVDGGGGARVVTRQQFAKMNPAEQAKIAAAAGEGTVKLID